MSCFSGISSLDKCQILAAVNSVSSLLSKDLNNDDLDMLGNILATIGNILMAFACVTVKKEDETVKISADG